MRDNEGNRFSGKHKIRQGRLKGNTYFRRQKAKGKRQKYHSIAPACF
jgi:hypothetical protein